jgi:chromate transporter
VSGPLVELLRVFLRLGATAFGGPAAHLAMMEDEVVTRRGWLSREEFLDLLGATNLIPGPNSTEMAIHIGHRRAGWTGLLVAGFAFIVPAMVIVWALAWAYVRFGRWPGASGILYGVKPVVVAVVVQALVRLGSAALKSRGLAVLAAAAVAARAMAVDELVVLFGAGLVAAVAAHGWGRSRDTALGLVASARPLALAGVAVVPTFQLSTLFFAFLKIGAVLFGSGYVLVAFLRSELVVRLGWLTDAQLLDAVAVGQVTPGPVFTTATFVGYVLGGHAGAAVATAGVFLPAFVFVALSAPLVPRLRRSPWAGGFLDGVNVASLALMAVVTAQIGRSAVPDVFAAALAATSAVLLLGYRVNSSWLVVGGAALGVLVRGLR